MNKNDRLKQLCHVITAALILPISFKLFERSNFKLSVVFLVLGILFAIVAALYEHMENKYGSIVKLFFLAESVVLGFAAFIQIWALHKKTMALTYVIAGIVFFMLFLFFLYEKETKKKKKRRRHRSSSKYDSPTQ